MEIFENYWNTIDNINDVPAGKYLLFCVETVRENQKIYKVTIGWAKKVQGNTSVDYQDASCNGRSPAAWGYIPQIPFSDDIIEEGI